VVLEKDGEDGQTGFVKNEEVLQRIEQKRHILHTVA